MEKYLNIKFKRPYVGKSRKEIKEQIMAKQVHVKIGEIPDGWSEESADFINRVNKYLFKVSTKKASK
jgi:hypothetical protein